MTSIAVVANKSAVAISADTRASSSLHGSIINDTSQKIFKTSDNSIASVYGDAEVCGVPWRNILTLNKGQSFNVEDHPLGRARALKNKFIDNFSKCTEHFKHDVSDHVIEEICKYLPATGLKLPFNNEKSGYKQIKKLELPKKDGSDKFLATVDLKKKIWAKIFNKKDDYPTWNSSFDDFANKVIGLFSTEHAEELKSGLVFVQYFDRCPFPEVYHISYHGTHNGLHIIKHEELFNPINNMEHLRNGGLIKLFGSSSHYHSIIKGLDPYTHHKIDLFLKSTKRKITELKHQVKNTDIKNDTKKRVIVKMSGIEADFENCKSEIDTSIKSRFENEEFYQRTNNWSDSQLLDYSAQLVKMMHFHQRLNKESAPTTGDLITACLINKEGVRFN